MRLERPVRRLTRRCANRVRRMVFDPGPLVLRGKYVELRPLAPEHAPALARAAAESRETYGYNPVPNGPDETRAYVQRALIQRERGQRYPFAIYFHGQLVGSTSYAEYQPWEWPAGCELQRTSAPDAVEVGYTWLSASAQRTSCNTESKLLLLEHAFEGWSVHRVSFRTDVRNERSRRAIERLGARFDGSLRANMPGRDCTVRSSAFYSIIAEEWPAVRLRLRSLLE